MTEFAQRVDGWRQQRIARTKRDTAAAGRPVQYLAGFERKDDLVQKIRDERGVAENVLIAVLSTLEMPRSFDV